MSLRVLFCVTLGVLVFKICAQEDEGGYTFVNKVRYPFSEFFDPFMGVSKK